MSEVIIISDSSDEEIANVTVVECHVESDSSVDGSGQEEKTPQHILEMVDLTERLNQNFLSEAVADKEIDVWRMKLNPFRSYGFISNSKYSFKIENYDEKQQQNNNTDYCVSFTDDENTDKPFLLDKRVELGVKNKNKNDIHLVENDQVESVPTLHDGGNFLPYYLENFNHILVTVLTSDYSRLFNENELRLIQNFQDLTNEAKMLYIRLYNRKRDWFRRDKILYPKIADDLVPMFNELISQKYMINETKLDELDKIYDLLTLNDARLLADNFKLKLDQKSRNKSDIIRSLKRHGYKQKTIFMSKKNSMKSLITKKAKNIIGECVKLSEESCSVFTRVILLFCLTTPHLYDKHGQSGHNNTTLLYQMLQHSLGDIKYPTFKVDKASDIFENRKQLIDYSEAMELENDLELAIQNKDYSSAQQCYEKVRSIFIAVIKGFLENTNEKYCLKVPTYLACFSKELVIIRLVQKCVDILEKQRCYSEAVTLLELLLAQKYVRFSSRGYLWERLILDVERYIKDKNRAFVLTTKALNDPFLRTGRRYDIIQRNKRLKKSSKNSKNDYLCDEDFFEEITQPNEETIQANVFIESSKKNRAVFLSHESNDELSLSNVEQHVITHYKRFGFMVGKHGEGSTVTTLFFLLFWDIIFMDIENVFHSKYQIIPLDMFDDSFYVSRAESINKRMSMIYFASDDFFRTHIESTWKANYGTQTIGANWDIFNDEIEASELAICLGGKVLGGICELLSKDFRRRRAGFPDLIVWSTEKRTCKIIEVKGPGDKLSTKQIVWLDILTYLGADAFACYVTGIGGKRKFVE